MGITTTEQFDQFDAQSDTAVMITTIGRRNDHEGRQYWSVNLSFLNSNGKFDNRLIDLGLCADDPQGDKARERLEEWDKVIARRFGRVYGVKHELEQAMLIVELWPSTDTREIEVQTFEFHRRRLRVWVQAYQIQRDALGLSDDNSQ